LTAFDDLSRDDLSRDTVDFGRLSTKDQIAFVRRLVAEPQLRAAVRELNAHVASFDEISQQNVDSTIKQNRQVIAENYSLDVIGKQLGGLYQEMLASDMGEVRCERSTAAAVLNFFVDPRQLFPIRLDS